MQPCSTCNRAAIFRLDAYACGNFPPNRHNLACREHLADTVLALEEQLALLDDEDTLCVTVLDQPAAPRQAECTTPFLTYPPMPRTLSKSVPPQRKQ